MRVNLPDLLRNYCWRRFHATVLLSLAACSGAQGLPAGDSPAPTETTAVTQPQTRTSHPCCAPDALAHGDTSPADPCNASGRDNSSLHGSANRHTKSGAHAPAELNAGSHAATASYPNRDAKSGAYARAKPDAASHGATDFYPNCHAIDHSNSGAHGDATTHAYPHRDSGAHRDAHRDANPDANPCAHP